MLCLEKKKGAVCKNCVEFIVKTQLCFLKKGQHSFIPYVADAATFQHTKN